MQFVSDHHEAVNADLMKRGYTLDDVGGALTWDALGDFIAKTDPGSALSYEIDPERAQWGTIDGTNTILADIYDQLATINYNMVALLSKRLPKKPKPYKRPGKKEERHIGTAVPITDVKKMIFERLRGGS